MSRVFRFSLLLAFFFAIDKLLGVLRQILIARQFGLSRALDIYNAANNVPDLLFALIFAGSLSVAVVPVLAEYRTLYGREAAWEVFSQLTNLTFLVISGVAILLALVAGPLVAWQLGIAPGFTAGNQAVVAYLMRLNLIATVIFAVGGLAMAALQANQHFLLPAIGFAVYDVGLFLGAIFLAPETGYQIGPWRLPAAGMGITGLVAGSIIGALIHLLLQIPGLLYYHFRWTPRLDLRHPGVQQTLRLLGPRLLSMLFIQLAFVARDNLASRLQEGAVTTLTYGWLIAQVPVALIGTAVGTALLPTLSEQVTAGDAHTFEQSLNRALRVVLALTLPVAVLLMATLEPLLSVLDFAPEQTRLVAWTGRAYLLGILAQIITELVMRACYALQRPRPPLLAASLNLAAFLVSAVLFYRPLGAAGIALGSSFGFTIEALTLSLWLYRRTPGIWRTGNTLWRAAAGAALGGAIVLVLYGQILPPTFLGAIAALSLAGLASLMFVRPELRTLVKI